MRQHNVWCVDVRAHTKQQEFERCAFSFNDCIKLNNARSKAENEYRFLKNSDGLGKFQN
jgi:hypothetical protein